MSKKLYVGNLPYSIDDKGLEEMFSKAGAIASAVVIKERDSQRSKGFGFVEFDKDEEADAAIEMFNGKDHDGRALTVNEARPMEPRN